MRVVRICVSLLGAEHWFDATDTRASVQAKLGEPVDVSAPSRKHRSRCILVYDPIERLEFHFEREQLFLIYQEKSGVPTLSVTFDQ